MSVIRRTHKKARATGIEVIGVVPWGTHICQFYETAEDLISTLVPYFKSGLENNELCIWVTAEPFGVEKAKEALKLSLGDLGYYETKNQIQILDCSEFYRQKGTFDDYRIFQQLLEMERLALKGDFDGLRISGNVSWLHQEEWVNFVNYESAVDASIHGRKIIAICSYPFQRYQPAEIVDIVSNHRNILLRRTDKIEYISNNGYGYVVKLRNIGFTYAEIGRIMGLSRQRIAQILGREKESGSKEQRRQSIALLTSGEAAKFLNVHINTVRRWSDSGVLPGYRIGQRNDRRFRLKDLEEFLNNKTSKELT